MDDARRSPADADASALAGTGALLLEAGLPVTDVRTGLIAAGAAASRDDLSFSVLPSVVIAVVVVPPIWRF